MGEFMLRRVPRYPVHLAVVELNGRTENDCHLLDLSAGGSLLEAPFPLQIGDEVRGSFVVPGRGLQSFTGQVEWLRPALYRDGYFLLGLSFPQDRWEFDQLGEELYFAKTACL